MNGTVVGVLRGGPSREHEISLLSGHAVVANLPRTQFTVRDIYIDKQGTWHERGKPFAPADILRTLDVAVIALHGAYGEDGEVQKLLERFSIPYTGSDSLGSYLAMHSVLSKERAKEAGLKTPRYVFIQSGADVEKQAYEITRNFQQPVVVKPVRWGSSIGASVVGGYAQVYQAIGALLAESDGVIVEEFIRGTKASVGVVEGLRGEQLYSLPIIETVLTSNRSSSEIIPARFPKVVADELSSSARLMHDALGLRHYSHSSFMVTPRGIYYLETSTLPHLTKDSAFPKSLAAVGVSLRDFLAHVVGMALV